MDVLAQIKEQLEHIKAFRKEIADTHEQIEQVKRRIDDGKMYGTESDDMRKYMARIKELGELIRKKEATLKDLHQQRQYPLFSL